MRSDHVLYALALVVPLAVLYQYLKDDNKDRDTNTEEKEPEQSKNSEEKSASGTTTIMQAERSDLPAPKDDPYTQAELKAFDGSDPDKPIYVAIKGTHPCYTVAAAAVPSTETERVRT